MRISIQKCKVIGSASWIYRLRMKDNDRKRYEHTEHPNIECYDLIDNNCGDGQPCWDTIRKVFCFVEFNVPLIARIHCKSGCKNLFGIHSDRGYLMILIAAKHIQVKNLHFVFSLVMSGVREPVRSRSMAQ